MKSIISIVNESKSEYFGYSMPEMINDLKFIEGGPSMAEKKEMASKYKIDSKKAGEIANAILLQMRAYRFNAKEFNDDDVRYFHKLEVADKVKFKEESTEFLLFLKDKYWKKMEEQKLTNKIMYVNKRDWNYMMSGSQKYTIQLYLKCVEAIESRDENLIKSKNEKEEILKVIIAKLVEQTKEFHDEYIESARKFAENAHKNAPKNAEKFLKLYEDLKKKADEFENKLREEKVSPMRRHHNPELNALRKQTEDAYSNYRTQRQIAKTPKKEFVDKIVDDTERAFNNNINNLADKIMSKEFDYSKLDVKRIAKDPKYFELEVTDGNNTLYARSIWAAEWSDKMVAHIRFIITNKRKS